MIIHEGIEGLRELPRGAVLSIGNFDGVHRGHLTIIDLARQLRAAAEGSRLAIVTFEPHPLTVLRPELAPPRLTPFAMKRELLAAVGVDDLVVLPPRRDVLDRSAEDFFAVLRDEVRPSHLVEGDNFNFGKDRKGTVGQLRQWTAGTAMQLHVIDPVEVALLDMQLVEVNSSLIRWLIARGRVRDAAICLARPYSITGMVVEGNHRGGTIGVPTANLEIVDQLVPGDGVYAGRCMIGHDTFACAISIGSLPTFNGNRRQVEAHLIGFEGDLYGRRIAIDVIDWLRDQRKFTGIEPLKNQIARDIIDATSRCLIDPAPSYSLAVSANDRAVWRV